MHGFGAGVAAGGDHRVNDEIALRRWRGAQASVDAVEPGPG